MIAPPHPTSLQQQQREEDRGPSVPEMNEEKKMMVGNTLKAM
jgi:hypothetical protein